MIQAEDECATLIPVLSRALLVPETLTLLPTFRQHISFDLLYILLLLLTSTLKHTSINPYTMPRSVSTSSI